MRSPLRDRLRQEELLLAPGVYDALTALLAEQAGFEALYLSGASIAYTRLGRSDVGLVTASEVADTLTNICERVSRPVVVDADTGFGNALNTIRTVKMFERAGASALQLEDQQAPKRCGHLEGKSLISTGEMCGKIKAALDTRDRALIFVRTDAVAVEGLEPALARAEKYAEAGADMLFIEALRSVDEMKLACARFKGKVPMMANMVEGGMTPVLSVAELQAIGYAFAIFPGGTVRSIAFGLQEYYATLKRDGSTARARDRMLDFNGLNKTIGTPELLDLGKKYDA